MSDNYLDIAKIDIKYASIAFAPEFNPTNDEMIYKMSAYHVQQAYEKLFKYILHDVHGIDDTTRQFKTHSISDLITMVEEYTSFTVPDYVKEMAISLTEWEQNGRYPNSLHTVVNDISEGINNFEYMLDYISQYTNGICNENNSEEIDEIYEENTPPLWDDDLEL